MSTICDITNRLAANPGPIFSTQECDVETEAFSAHTLRMGFLDFNEGEGVG